MISLKSWCINIWKLKFDIWTFFISGVVLNSLELVLDLELVRQFWKDDHQYYAIMFAAPILASGMFIAFFCWEFDKKTCDYTLKSRKSQVGVWIKSFVTWILVVLQIYPQYRNLKFICRKIKGKDDLQEEKSLLVRVMHGIKPYLETVPQILVLNCYNVAENVYLGADGADENVYLGADGAAGNVFGFGGLLKGLKFNKGCVTAVLGLINLLHFGICKILPEVKGKLGGRLTLGYFLLFVSVTTIFIGKGMALAVFVLLYQENTKIAVAMWFALFILPQLLMSIGVLVYSLKSKIFSVMRTHFPLLLCPVYTCFSLGPVEWKPSPSPRSIAISPSLTTINVIITLAINVFVERMGCPDLDQARIDYPHLDKQLLDVDVWYFNYLTVAYYYGYAVYFSTFVGGFCAVILIHLEKFGNNWVEFQEIDPKNVHHVPEIPLYD